MRKVYIVVSAVFDTEGMILPQKFTWKDGRTFDIDRVIDVRPAASLKAGGFGLRYTVQILGKQTHMWLEDGCKKWFVEAK